MTAKRMITMLLCSVTAAGVLVGAGATAALAYCPTSPSGDPYDSSDPRAGDYDGTEVYCPWTGDTGSAPGPSGWVDPDWSSKPATGAIDWRVFDVTPGPCGGRFDEHKTIYETTVDGSVIEVPRFDIHTQGQTADEYDRTIKGGDHSGVSKDLEKIFPGVRRVVNPNAGKRSTSWEGKTVTLEYINPRTGKLSLTPLTSLQSLARIANLTFETQTDTDGSEFLSGVRIAFTSVDIPLDTNTLTDAIFRLSNGSIESCVGKNGLFVCDFYHKSSARTDVPAWTPPKLLPDEVTVSEQSIPICPGGVVDAGFGKTTRFTIAQAGCDAAPDVAPVTLAIDTIYTDDTSVGIPFADSGDGSIVYTPTKEAAGQYVSARVWAVSADGTKSWPFYVTFRVRNAPEVEAAPEIETLRGMESVTDGGLLFSDIDVDEHAAESGDKLSYEIVSAPEKGTAWFDAAGDLHYNPLNLTDAYSDSVTVKAVDSFGLPSGELVIPITVGEVIPGCATGVSETDSNTPIRIEMRCWLTGPEGWTQRPGHTIEYSIVEGPDAGSITSVDSAGGAALFTPDGDRSKAGPVSFTFKVEYNGEVREASYTVNVHPAP